MENGEAVGGIPQLGRVVELCQHQCELLDQWYIVQGDKGRVSHDLDCGLSHKSHVPIEAILEAGGEEASVEGMLSTTTQLKSGRVEGSGVSGQR